MNNRDEKNTYTGIEIAVIGMAGRFPGARNIDEFRENLKNGVESISFLTDEELTQAGVSPEVIKNPTLVKTAGGVLEDKAYFDAAFFGYTPMEAEVMDPQYRIFHQCAWEALEHAGYNPEAYKGLIGVYAGCTDNFYWQVRVTLAGKREQAGSLAAESLLYRDYLCTRVSYKLNLKGPAVLVQTACSTSLVAVHMACRALITAECDMALAGGVKILPQKNRSYIFEEGMIASPDGHCRAFDAKAKGTTVGDGVGIVVLKRLKHALADRDFIHAVINGSATNNDGIRKIGYTAPSIEGQVEVIKKALRIARVEPESITYIECHGTGTTLGDPIEIEALTRAFNTDKKKYCPIGSVKTNIGHLDAAAGIAAFIKAVLAVTHRFIPPSLNFETPNPKIDFENSPFYVNKELTEWKNDTYPLRAGISSFGIGGTNAHVILEEAPIAQSAERQAQSAGREYQLILLSAKTENALDKMTKNLEEYFKNSLLNRGNHENPVNPGPTLADIAYTLQAGRKTFPYRRMLVCASSEDAVKSLSTQNSRRVKTFLSQYDNRDIIFMFPGLGAQYMNMGLELYQKEPVFRQEMDRCFDILKPLMGHDIKEILYPTHPAPSGHPSQEGSRGGSPCPPKDCIDSLGQGDHRGSPLQSDRINQTEITQPVIFAIEYALAQLLMKWGIKPSAMIGYSFGEYVAACISGVFSLADALKLVVLRAQLIQQQPPGAMLSIPLSREELAPFLNDELSLSIDNGPSCVVGGPPETVETIEKQMKDRNLICVRLQTSQAIHSKMMEPILKEFREIVSHICLDKPQIPYISNVTGKWITVEDAKDPGYWSSQLRETVRFAEGLKELLKIPGSIFVEVGPGSDLSALWKHHVDKESHHLILHLIKRAQSKTADIPFLLDKIGYLWGSGAPRAWSEFYDGEKRYRLPLPTYPFEKQRYWLDDFQQVPQTSQLVRKEDMADWIYFPRWTGSTQVPLQKEKEGPLCFLLFINDCPLVLQLVKRLRSIGTSTEAGQDLIVITVAEGETFKKINQHKFLINSCTNKDYRRLFTELNRMGVFPNRIVHFWNVASDDDYPGASVSGTGFYSLLYMAKAIGKQNFPGEMRIDVVTTNIYEITGNEILVPEKAVVLGPLKVIPQEYPDIICRCIDIELPQPGSPAEEKLAGFLIQEFFTDLEALDTDIAFRSNYRWIKTYEPVRLESSRQGSVPLKEQGVYLVTGGLGDMGFTLAEYLVKQVRARLILTGSSGLPAREQWDHWLSTHAGHDTISRKIKKIRQLETAGGKVLAFAADAADKQAMAEVIHKAEETFGPVNGLIHAAGVTKGKSFFCPIADVGEEECIRQFRPKIEGTLVLASLFQNKPLDFCMLTSSISTILGGLGFAAYAAANAFMDAFAFQANRSGCLHWISVNWDSWEFNQERDRPSQLGASLAEFAMTPQQGEEIFERISTLIHSPGSQVVVSTGDLQTRIHQWEYHMLALGQLKNQQEYWLSQFTGELPVLSMPTDFPRPSLRSVEGDVIAFHFDQDLTRQLNHLLKETGTTLYMMLLALYIILLSKYTLQEDIIIGSPIAGRYHTDLENIIGLLVETIAIRSYPCGDRTFEQFLEQIKESTLKAYENQGYPFGELLKHLDRNEDPSRNPLFDAILNVQSQDGQQQGEPEIMELKTVPYEGETPITAKVDISLEVIEKQDAVIFYLEYCTRLFKRETMEAFITFFRQITRTVLDNRKIKLRDIKISHDLEAATSTILKEIESEFEF